MSPRTVGFALIALLIIGLVYRIWGPRPSLAPAPEPPSPLPSRPHPEPAPPPVSPPSTTISPSEHEAPQRETVRKTEILRSILRSGNDNDPRLDTEFRALSPELKRALRAEYNSLPPERRNARGTVVFLLGRELRECEDFNFLNEVLNEAPCGSLQDCARLAATKPVREKDAESDPAIEVTLAYPQLVVLRSLERVLQDPSSTEENREKALRLAREARQSPVKVVSDAAARLTGTP